MSEHDDLRFLVGLLARRGAQWVSDQLQAQGQDLSWRVWVVWSGDHEDRYPAAIYTTEELAKQHEAAAAGLEAEDFPLSRSVPELVRRGEKVWLVELDLANGRPLEQKTWFVDHLADGFQGAVKRFGFKQFPDQGELSFRWVGWATEAGALERAEDARQAWVARYGVALKPVTEPSRVQRPEAVETIRERATRKHLEDQYRLLHEGLQAKMTAKEKDEKN